MLGWDATNLVQGGVRVSEESPRNEKKHDLLGWMLFVVSAAFFMASSIRAGDVVGLLGGVFFLLACVAFLVPYFGPRKGSRGGVRRGDPR